MGWPWLRTCRQGAGSPDHSALTAPWRASRALAPLAPRESLACLPAAPNLALSRARAYIPTDMPAAWRLDRVQPSARQARNKLNKGSPLPSKTCDLTSSSTARSFARPHTDDSDDDPDDLNDLDDHASLSRRQQQHPLHLPARRSAPRPRPSLPHPTRPAPCPALISSSLSSSPA